jgi:hypothetical protein
MKKANQEKKNQPLKTSVESAAGSPFIQKIRTKSRGILNKRQTTLTERPSEKNLSQNQRRSISDLLLGTIGTFNGRNTKSF